MDGLLPYSREAGVGTTVLCLHSNASSSAQWRGLMELLAPHWRVVAPDLLGAGRSPAWPDAALAVRIALQVPQRVASLVLYEPTLFGLLDPERPGSAAAAGIRNVAALRQPVLLLGGATSAPAASEVLRLLRQALPRAESLVFADLGRMGPVTDAARVNLEIERFLLAQTYA